MKLNIYGGNFVAERGLRFLSGAYDPKAGKAVLVVQDDDGNAGTLTLDVSEAKAVCDALNSVPTAERVSPSQKGVSNGNKEG